MFQPLASTVLGCSGDYVRRPIMGVMGSSIQVIEATKW